MAENCMQEGEREARSLHRDNSRFKFFHDNGKPVLAENCEGTLPTTPILQLIRKRGLAR